MFIPSNGAFQFIPKLFTLLPWPWLLTDISVNFTYAISLSLEVGLSYFTCTFLVMRSFRSCQTKEALAMTLIEADILLVAYLWPSLFASDRGCNLYRQNLVGMSQWFVCEGMYHKRLARKDIRGRAFMFYIYILCDKIVLLIPKVLALWSSPLPLTYIS